MKTVFYFFFVSLLLLNVNAIEFDSMPYPSVITEPIVSKKGGLIGSCRIRDSLILEVIFQEMGGSEWNYEANRYFDLEVGVGDSVDIPNAGNAWGGILPIDSLHGVRLNNDGCVTSLILPSAKLSGKIPDTIGALSALEKIYLSNNPKIEGPLPEKLYQLSNLKELDLHKDSISGIISPAIQGLTSLTSLNLITNDFSGEIPKEIGMLQNLSTLWIANNKNLAGSSIPEEIGQLKELVKLNLCCNNFIGPIPDFIGQLKKLIFLFLNNNSLSGELPESLLEMDALFQCVLNFNRLEGEIPDSIDQLQSLRFLSLDSNFFVGTIPESLGNLNLKSLTLRLNNFSGSFPDFSHLPFEILTLDHNKFESFPDYSSVDSWNTSFKNWTGCQVQNNRLTFEDILPNMPIGDTAYWKYSDQDSIFVDTTIILHKGADLLIDLEIDKDLSTNTYYWYKNNDPNPFDTTSINQLSIIQVSNQEAGTYWCKVKNENVPDLLLFSYPIEVLVQDFPAKTIRHFGTTCFPEEVSMAPDSVVLKNQFDQDSLIIITVTGLATEIDNEELVAYYPFDADATDLSGFGNNGLVNAAQPVADRFGNDSCALSLDGEEQFIRLRHKDWISFTTEDTFAISFWLEMENQVDRAVDHNEVFVKWNDTKTPFPYALRFYNEFSPNNTGNLFFGVNDGVDNSVCDSVETIVKAEGVDYRDGKMHHVVFGKEGDYLYIIIDNELRDSVTIIGGCEIYNDLDVFIGRRGNDIGDRLKFKGKVDDLRIYMRSLSLEEISILFEQENPKPVMVDTLICPGESVSFGDDVFSEAGEYEVVVGEGDPCDSLIYLNLSVREESDILCKEGENFFNRVVSPNGDGINEVLRFKESLLNENPNNEIFIYNRYGDLVFSTTNYQNDWGGTHNGNLLLGGTYYYLLNLGVNDSEKGFILLLTD